uniref:Uncharacterized protein n=1 Tax=Biomphalaria glabrata TaxID=6526 RepID=A0A2C9JHD2_BIOGL
MNINMLLVHLAVLVSIVDSQNFASGFHSYFNFICPANHIIDKISSVYSSGHKDRSFEIGCRSVRSTMDCTPSDYVNIFDKLLNYTCPGSQVLSGVGSEYSNDKADRRFKFFCCKVKDSEFQRCHETFFIHDFQQEMKLNVKEGQAIKHIYSHHLDESNDRQWKFTLWNVAGVKSVTDPQVKWLTGVEVVVVTRHTVVQVVVVTRHTGVEVVVVTCHAGLEVVITSYLGLEVVVVTRHTGVEVVVVKSHTGLEVVVVTSHAGLEVVVVTSHARLEVVLENFSDKDALASHLTETVAYVADYMEYFVDNGIKVPKNITNTIVDILSAFRKKHRTLISL